MEFLPNSELYSKCSEALEEVLQTLLQYEELTDSWVPYKTENREILTSKLQSPSGLNIMRADCVICAPIETVAAVVYEMDQNTKWDPVLETTSEVARFSDITVVRNTYWAPFPVSRRDFVLAIKLFKDEEKVVDASVSVTTPLCPEEKGFVRGHLHYGGFVLRKISDRVTKAVHVVYADPKGSLPHFLVNMGQKKHYQYLEAIKKYLESQVDASSQ